MIVDTSALVALLRKEPEAPAIRDAMAEATQRFISAFTLLEARTVLWGRHGPAMLHELQELLDAWGPEVRAFDAEQSGLAFAAYRKYGRGSGHQAQLNFGDCAAYALAVSLDLPLLFKGEDFRHTDVKTALA